MSFGPQRGHIAYIFENFFSDFGLLLLAIIIGLIRGDMTMILENTGVLVIVLLGPLGRIISYLNTIYSVDEEKLVIKSGWIRKETLEVPISTVTTVDFSQNIFHQIFGVYRLNIDNSSNIASGETKVHMTLSKGDADIVKHLLIRGRDGLDGLNYAVEQMQPTDLTQDYDLTGQEEIARNHHKYVIGIGDLLLMGALKSKTLFMIEVIGAIAVISSFIEIPDEFFIDEAVNFVDAFGLSLVILVAFFGLFLLAAVGGMAISFVRYYGFKILDNGEAIKIEYGLLNRKTYTMPKKKISGFYYEQSALMRLAKVGTLNLMAVGYGAGSDETTSEESILFPLIKAQNIQNVIGEILPEMKHGEDYQRPEKKALRYFFIRFTVFFSIGFFGACLYLPRVSAFFDGIWVLGMVLLVMALVSAVLSYKCTAVYGTQEHFSMTYGGFKKMTVFIKTNMIESIETNGSIWKRKKGIVNISIGCLAPMGLANQGVDNLPEAVFASLKEKLIY